MLQDDNVLDSIHLAPYIRLAKVLIGKKRDAGGNMFRHQIDTMGILLNYNYTDSVLLKASLIHDVIEDIPDFDVNDILKIDSESEDVYKLVLEVTKIEDQTKGEFLSRIAYEGSEKAKILKCADRISNMISLGFVSDPEFIKRYCDETELYILPIALAIGDIAMYKELVWLIRSRSMFIPSGYLEKLYTEQIKVLADV
ncbi:MAG: hypothetical protein ACTTIZ_00260 [Treponema sp.]